MGCDLCVSVTDKCNFSCMYCSRSTMEDYTPLEYKNNILNEFDFVQILKKIANVAQPYSISITGGEPFFNDSLPFIAKSLKPLSKRIEITTNASLFTQEKWEPLKNVFNRVKVSLDTLNENAFKKITHTKNFNYINNVIKMIIQLKSENENVAVNAVILKDYLNDLFDLVNFCLENKIKIQLFEFTYNADRKSEWLKQFVPLYSIISMLETKFGRVIKEQTTHGDYFKIFHGEQYIRLRSSSQVTKRNVCCQNCPHYCYEGLLFLRVSCHGWVSICPFSQLENGVLITKEMSQEEVSEKIKPLLHILETAIPVHNSYQDFLNKRIYSG